MRKQLNVNYCVLNITCNYVDISKKSGNIFCSKFSTFYCGACAKLKLNIPHKIIGTTTQVYKYFDFGTPDYTHETFC